MAQRIGDPAAAERAARAAVRTWFGRYSDLGGGDADAPLFAQAITRVITAQAKYEEVTEQAELPMRAVTAQELLSLVQVDVAEIDRSLAAAADVAERIAEQLEWLPSVQAIVHGPDISAGRIDHLALLPSGVVVVRVVSATGELATRTVEGNVMLLAGDATVPGLDTLEAATKEVAQLLDVPARAVLVVNGAQGGPIPAGSITVCTPDHLDEVVLTQGSTASLDPEAASRVASALASGATTPSVPTSIGADVWQRVVCAAAAAQLLDAMHVLFGHIRHALATTTVHPDAAAAATSARAAQEAFAATVLQTLGAATPGGSFAHADPLSRWAAAVCDGPAGHAMQAADADAVHTLIDALSAMAAAPTTPPVLLELDRGFGGDLLTAVRVRGTTAAVAQLLQAHDGARRTREQIVQQLEASLREGGRVSDEDMDTLRHHVAAAADAVDQAHGRWRGLQLDPNASSQRT